MSFELSSKKKSDVARMSSGNAFHAEETSVWKGSLALQMYILNDSYLYI